MLSKPCSGHLILLSSLVCELLEDLICTSGLYTCFARKHLTLLYNITGDTVHLVHVIFNPRASTDSERPFHHASPAGLLPIYTFQTNQCQPLLVHANAIPQGCKATQNACTTTYCYLRTVMIAAVLTGLVCHAVGAAAGTSSFQDVQDMKEFERRLEQTELEKIEQRFHKMLQAAGMAYEVSVLV